MTPVATVLCFIVAYFAVGLGLVAVLFRCDSVKFDEEEAMCWLLLWPMMVFLGVLYILLQAGLAAVRWAGGADE